jgi:riboflavin transporter FmnP
MEEDSTAILCPECILRAFFVLEATMKSNFFSTKNLVLMAMLAAVSYVIVLVAHLFPIQVIGFLSYEPKDVIITIAGFLLGPLASVIVSAVVSLVEMVSISQTGPIGALMNFLSTCSFACTAAVLYKRMHSLKGAVLSLACAAVAMTGVMVLWNWLITPLYMGVPRQEVVGMLIPVFLPFNLLKAGFNSALILALYKPLTTALRSARLLPPSQSTHSQTKIGLYIFAAALLATCIVLLLVMRCVL